MAEIVLYLLESVSYIESVVQFSSKSHKSNESGDQSSNFRPKCKGEKAQLTPRQLGIFCEGFFPRLRFSAD